MAVFLTHEPDHDGYRGIFWKGFGNNHRTPSAWLVPKSNRVTYRVSTTSAREVWGTSAAALPTRRWCHLAFSLDADGLMRFYVDGLLDSVVEIVGDPVANAGPLYVGKDMSQPGVRAFIAHLQMHTFALADEDVQQAAAHALRAVPNFDGEAERDFAIAAEVEREIAEARASEFHHLMEALPPSSSAVEVGGDASGAEDVNTEDADLPDEFVADRDDGVSEDGGETAAVEAASEGGSTSDEISFTPTRPSSSVPELEEEEEEEEEEEASAEETREDKGGTNRTSIAVSTLVSTREQYANEQFRAAEQLRTSALTTAEGNVQADGLAAARAAYARAAAADHVGARRVLATMLEGGYGGVAGERSPGAAIYHRLRAAAAGDPGAQLAVGTDHLIDGMGDGVDQRAACPVALYYLFHAATTAYERNSKPGGQARVERIRLFEGVANHRGDHKGESDDRMMYLRQAAELGDWRAMLAMANGYYWGNFGLPRDLDTALLYYQRAHDAGALQGTVGVAKMTLKGEGGPRNLTKALEYYNNAANRSSADALNGLGYMYFYGDPVEKNETMALSYFRRAAELGNSDGIVNTGLMLRAGLGTTRNVTEAHQHFVKCANMDHPSCLYQAALLESVGEAGVERNCQLAATRYRRVAEAGTWMAPLADGLKAHLAGNASLARWLYDHAATMGVPVARYNAAWLHEAHARHARVFRDGAIEGEDEEEEDGRDIGGRNAPEWEIVAASIGRSTGRAVEEEHPLQITGRRSAGMLQHYLERILRDPATDRGDVAWATLARGDCMYYGPQRPGGCPVRSHKGALRMYLAAVVAARGAVREGHADGRQLLGQALYSEAWMRAHGEGCAVDRRRARAALWEGLAEGGWQSSMAIAPPLVALALVDVVAAVSRLLGTVHGDAAAAMGTTRWRRRDRRAREPRGKVVRGGSSDSVLKRFSTFSTAFLEGIGRATFNLIESLEKGGGIPHWPAVSRAFVSFVGYVLGFVAGWSCIVRPLSRWLFGLELNQWPLPWGHGEYWYLREGQWVRDGGVMGHFHGRMRQFVEEAERAQMEEERAAATQPGPDTAAAAGAPAVGVGTVSEDGSGDADAYDEVEEDGTDESDAEIEAAWRGSAAADASGTWCENPVAAAAVTGDVGEVEDLPQ